MPGRRARVKGFHLGDAFRFRACDASFGSVLLRQGQVCSEWQMSALSLFLEVSVSFA